MTTPAASAIPASPGQCSVAELRKLFLFEKLTDDQLEWLCANGTVLETAPGMVYVEGEPAEALYVLLSGTIVLSRRIGEDEVEVNRTSGPGTYGGAFFAYLRDRVPQVYNNSLRATVPSRFYVLRAAKFAHLMTNWFPMATHLLEGLLFGTKNAQEAIGQRERLLALGSLSAGLAHELNNPAAAAVRATESLRDRVASMRGKLAVITAKGYSPAFVTSLVRLQEDAVERASKARELSPIEAADAEDALTDWLDAHGIAGSWDLAPTFVQAGLDAGWLDQVAMALDDRLGEADQGGGSAGQDEGAGARALESAIRWIGYTIESELLMNEIADSVTRISALVGAARQYSQLDRAPYQVVDIHELLDSTLVMLEGKLRPHVLVVKEYDRNLPRIPAYPAELNQVWTNLIDNAVAAMDGEGTLTIRTAAERNGLLVEFADTGSGIPDEIKSRIFEPFFTTKPVGQGTGLGLDISSRIIVGRHHGDIKVESEPGNTRFRIWLPVTGADGARDDASDDGSDDAADDDAGAGDTAKEQD